MLHYLIVETVASLKRCDCCVIEVYDFLVCKGGEVNIQCFGSEYTSVCVKICLNIVLRLAFRIVDSSKIMPAICLE